MKSRLFKTGGSYAVRIPKDWLPPSEDIILRKEGNRIILTPDESDLRKLAARFAEEGLLDFHRPAQPEADPAKQL